MTEKKIPEILSQKPEPEPQIRTFHRSKLLGWSGLVRIDKIRGWAENRRIELFRRKCEAQFGRLPTNDEIYNFMLGEKDFYIRELGKSILNNGIRIPIILDASGTLLDGNRRYVATRWAIDNNPDQKDDLVNIPAWVLDPDATSEQKHKVLVECNFVSDWKQDWPPYIRALTVYEDHFDNDMNLDQLHERYDIKKTELSTMIRVMDLIHEFFNFHNHSDEAFRVAYEHYHWFEEAYNKSRAKLDSDPELKEQFFTWMIEDKFQNMKQVGHIGEIRNNEEAWAVIRSNSPDAVKEAIHIVEGEKFTSTVDGDKKVKKIIKQLRKLTEQEIVVISPETLAELEIILKEVMEMSRAVTTPEKRLD